VAEIWVLFVVVALMRGRDVVALRARAQAEKWWFIAKMA